MTESDFVVISNRAAGPRHDVCKMAMDNRLEPDLDLRIRHFARSDTIDKVSKVSLVFALALFVCN